MTQAREGYVPQIYSDGHAWPGFVNRYQRGVIIYEKIERGPNHINGG